MGKEINCNCHYKYNGKTCEVVSFETTEGASPSKVKVRFLNQRETLCNTEDLSPIPLTESILQSCFKQKTIFRNAEWDTVWFLGGKNKVTIGEKLGNYYLFPKESSKPVIELLPEGFIQATNNIKDINPIQIQYLNELEKVYPELSNIINCGKVRL